MRTSEETAKNQRADAYRDLAMNEDDTIDIISKQRSQILDQITTLTRECDKAIKLEATAVNNEKEAVSAHKGSRGQLSSTVLYIFSKEHVKCIIYSHRFCVMV